MEVGLEEEGEEDEAASTTVASVVRLVDRCVCVCVHVCVCVCNGPYFVC